MEEEYIEVKRPTTLSIKSIMDELNIIVYNLPKEIKNKNKNINDKSINDNNEIFKDKEELLEKEKIINEIKAFKAYQKYAKSDKPKHTKQDIQREYDKFDWNLESIF